MTSPSIRRPEEKSGGAGLDEATISEHVSVKQLIEKDPSAGAQHRAYFQNAAWLYTEVMEAKVAATRDADAAILSANNAIAAGHQAKQLGFLKEAAALYISGARLHYRATSFVAHLLHTSHTGREWKSILLQAFEALGQIRELPGDDLEYWENRLAEVAAVLSHEVAAFNFDGMEQSRAMLAVFYVGQVCKNLVPYRRDADLTPLRKGTYDPGGLERIHASIAHLEFLGKFYAEAMSRIESLLANPISGLDDLVYALHVGIAAARKLERFDRHKEWLERLHRIVDSEREKHRSFDGRLYVVQQLANEFQFALQSWAMDDMHDASDLLAVAEMMKSRNLLDEMGGCGIEPSTPVCWNDRADEGPETPDGPGLPAWTVELATHGLDQEEFRQLAMISYWPVFDAGLQSRLNTRDEKRFDRHIETERKLLEAENNVVSGHGGFESSVRPAAPEDIRDALRDGELLIEFFIPRDPFSPNRYCWIVHAMHGGIASKSLYFEPSPGVTPVNAFDKVLIERGPLADITAKTRAAILNREDKKARGLLNRLFRSLFGGLINAGFEPEKFRRWIIIPHGPLHLVPLHALVDDKGRHLIERVPITTAPSATAWLRMLREERGPVERLLAVGNPKIGGDLPRLDEAEAEVGQIPDRAPWLTTKTLLTGSDATESRVRAEISQADIVHFATHTEFDWRDPRDAHRILLAGDGEHDGFLLASELRRMDLSNVRLAILNTCNGAVCRYGPGDEPLGLLSAFISSGAENILGSLWELRDMEAQRFILDFYEALVLGDPAIALQAASCHAITDRRHIADWAGMPLVGGGRPFASDGLW